MRKNKNLIEIIKNLYNREERVLGIRPNDLHSGSLYEVFATVQAGSKEIQFRIINKEKGQLWAFRSSPSKNNSWGIERSFKNDYELVGRFIFDPIELKENGTILVECRSERLFSGIERVPRITLIL